MAGLLVNLLSLSFIPAIVLARLPRSCVRDTNVLSCSSVRAFKNDEILSAAKEETSIDVIYLTERTPYCFCKILRLVSILKNTDILVFTHSSCTLSKFKKCGLKQPMLRPEVFAGLVVSVDDPRRNWALNYHVLHIWSKIQSVKNEKTKSLLYTGILKELKNEVKSLNIRARDKLHDMTSTLTRRRERLLRMSRERERRRKERERRRKERERRRKERIIRARIAEFKKKMKKKLQALKKEVKHILKQLKEEKRIKRDRKRFPMLKFVRPDQLQRIAIYKFFRDRKKRRRGRREVSVRRRPPPYESLFNLNIQYLMRMNSTHLETPPGKFRKLTLVGKLKPDAIHQAKKDSLSELQFRKSLNPAAHFWSALSYQPPALSQSTHSRMRRATKVSDPPTVIPYLAFVGGEFYSLFDQEGIQLAQQEVKPIIAEERLRAPQRNYPGTRVVKGRPVKRNRKRKTLAAKVRSSKINKGAAKKGGMTQTEVKKLTRESDHRMKSFIIFFVAITGTITIIAVLLIMAMRSSGKSPGNSGRGGRGTCPDDMCRQCMAKTRRYEQHMNNSEAEMCRPDPPYPYYDDDDPFCDRQCLMSCPPPTTGDCSGPCMKTTQTEGSCQPVIGGRHVVSEFEKWCIGRRVPQDKRLTDTKNYRQVNWNQSQSAPLSGDEPTSVRSGDDRHPGRTQPDTNWNANSKFYRNHSPLVSFLKSFTSEREGVMREHHREKLDIKRCHQKFLYQPQLHGQLIPASRLPHPARSCRPAQTTTPATQDEQQVTSQDNEIKLNASS